MPEPGKLADSQLGYDIRPGEHSMTKGAGKYSSTPPTSTSVGKQIDHRGTEIKPTTK
jgi:hypothetical protein